MFGSHKKAGARLAVIGGGAIGGFFAAAAESLGHQVTLCVRTPIPRLEIEEKGRVRVLSASIVTDPAQAGPVDWVILATKAQDTGGAAPWLRRFAGAGTPVVVAQNGIEHEARIRPLVEDGAIVPALVYVAAERIRPGRIVHHTGGRVVMPESVAGAAFATLMQGGLQVDLEHDFLSASWRKLLSNVAANPITALTMRRIGVLREAPVQDLARSLLEEAVAAGRAAGADIADGDVAEVLRLVQTYNETGGTSMFYDRLAGNPLEHEHLTGAVVRTGDRHGVPVPLNRALLVLLGALDAGLRAEREPA